MTTVQGSDRGRARARVTCTILAFLIGCGSAEDTTAPAAEVIAPTKDAIAKTTENGPVKATVTVWPGKPALGDAIYLRLTIDAPAGISVDAPFQEAGDQRMGRFKVVGFTRNASRKQDGGQTQEQTYTLEAPTSGKQRVPPLRLEMVDARAGRSGSGSGSVSLLAILFAGGVLAFRAVVAGRRVAAQRNAYDDAVLRLRALEGRGAPPSDEADSWFVELSSIVRAYVEQRYRIRAPELTTEEFLQVAVAAAAMSDDQRALLVQFLERCDRVKFAGYRPDADESIATLKAARGFVEDTRLREEKAA